MGVLHLRWASYSTTEAPPLQAMHPSTPHDIPGAPARSMMPSLPGAPAAAGKDAPAAPVQRLAAPTVPPFLPAISNVSRCDLGPGAGGPAAAAPHSRPCPPAPKRRRVPLPPPPEVPPCILAALRGGAGRGAAGGMPAASGQLHPAVAQAHGLLDGIQPEDASAAMSS